MTYIISIIPFIVLFVMIYTYGVNIPFSDDWAFVDMIDKYLSGTLTFQDLWAQHNEHRPLTMKVVRLISSSLTNWNLVSEMMFSATVAFLTFVVMAFQMSITFRILKIGNYGLLILFSSLMLAGLSQYENWTWGISTVWLMTNFFAVSSFCLIANRHTGYIKFVVACFCAVLASLTMAHGFLVFALGFFMLINQAMDKHSRLSPNYLKIVAWTLLGLLMTFIYSINYHKPSNHPALSEFLSQPVAFFKYIAAYPASSMFRDLEFEALVFGTISLLAFIVSIFILFIRMRRESKYILALTPWISIAAFVVGTGLLSAIGRLGFGWEQALAGRYTSLSALFCVALAVIIWTLMKDQEINSSSAWNGKTWGTLANGLVLFLIALSLFSSIRMFHYFPDFKAGRLIAKKTLLNGGDKNNLLLIFPDAEFVINKNEILKRRSLSLHMKN